MVIISEGCNNGIRAVVIITEGCNNRIKGCEGISEGVNSVTCNNGVF